MNEQQLKDSIEAACLERDRLLAEITRLRSAVEKAVEALKKLAVHQSCEDRWYSCPKSEEGCANDLAGDECNCRAGIAEEAITDLNAILVKEKGK